MMMPVHKALMHGGVYKWPCFEQKLSEAKFSHFILRKVWCVTLLFDGPPTHQGGPFANVCIHTIFFDLALNLGVWGVEDLIKR